jgi:hypothetical protein
MHGNNHEVEMDIHISLFSYLQILTSCWLAYTHHPFRNLTQNTGSFYPTRSRILELQPYIVTLRFRRKPNQSTYFDPYMFYQSQNGHKYQLLLPEVYN